MSKSYLKWVGGKSQIANDLINRFPSSFERYIEPFFGSCAMFFAYYGQEQDMFDVETPKALLNDSNKQLINTHRSVKQNVECIMRMLDAFQGFFDKAKDKADHYQRCRDDFNKTVIDQLAKEPWLPLAASFIAINKMCFNGLWRVNGKGRFNVPFNKKETTRFYDPKIIRNCAYLLSEYADLSSEDFESFIEEKVSENDFVFLDPPYIPLSNTSSFTSYTDIGWSETDNQRLSKCLTIINKRKAKFMMTNSNARLVYSIFGEWNIETIQVHRFVKAINCENESREKVIETVVTNY